MDLNVEQINLIRAILATKKGVLSKQRDYTISAINDLIKGKRLAPLHVGRPMNKLYQYAVDVLNIIGIPPVLVGDMDDWISMKSYDVYYILNGDYAGFDVVDILHACKISYDEKFLRDSLISGAI